MRLRITLNTKIAFEAELCSKYTTILSVFIPQEEKELSAILFAHEGVTLTKLLKGWNIVINKKDIKNVEIINK